MNSEEPEYGSFKIMQGGIEVAGGSGPYPAIQAEAAHYAAVYAQDGPVKVRIWKNRRRKQQQRETP